MRRLLLAILLLMPLPLAAQSRAGTGTLTVAVTDDRTSLPLPYAVITLGGEEGERFSDARGQLSLVSIAPGRYTMIVRRIGFSPVRQPVTIIADSTLTVNVRMQRLPQRLRAMRVTTARECPAPGVPSDGSEPELAALVALVRENAARYRLLAKQFPYTSFLLRMLGTTNDSVVFVTRLTQLSIESSTKGSYSAGNVVRRSNGTYSLPLPGILDLASDDFARTHCFFYGGVVKETTAQGEETWIRLDVSPADRLDSPDVYGSFYLDSATAQLRKMNLSLSRADRLPRQVENILGIDVSTKFVDIADGLSVVSQICGVTTLRPNPKAPPDVAAVMPIELQQITGYLFKKPPPEMNVNGGFPAPEWVPETFMSPKAVWCRTP